ncbi:MAG: homocysteine S-methyltransferase family protein [Oscillospiraceae bacterium]|nr:homocysteine S-methyltransferase family protein [Oscillospiraceae bacterium]
MRKQEFAARLAAGVLIADGATGSCLLDAGMPRGVPTPLWLEEHPEVLIRLQRAYVAAGSHAVYAPTFHANRICHRQQSIDRDVRASVRAMVALSREAVGDAPVYIAGDMGATGVLPQPFGPLGYDELFDAYAEQAQALAEAGVDFLAAETLVTAEEGVALLDAAASVCDLPVVCTMTVEADGGLMLGGSVFAAAADLEAMGAAAVGVNCSVGPDQLEAVVAGIRARVQVPVAAKPNAGMPVITERGETVYPMGPEAFAAHMRRLRAAGAGYLGGCCGAGPAYIRALCQALEL